MELLKDPHLLRPGNKPAQLSFTNGEGFTFASTVETPYLSCNLAHGKLFRTSQPGAPTVLLIHGWNAELHYIYGFPRLAETLSRQGFNTLTLELPFHMH